MVHRLVARASLGLTRWPGGATLTFSPGFSSSLPLLVDDEGVWSSPSRDTRTKSSLLSVDTESEERLIFPTDPLSSMPAAEASHRTAAHEWDGDGREEEEEEEEVVKVEEEDGQNHLEKDKKKMEENPS